MHRNTTLLGLGLGLASAISYGSNVPFARIAAMAGVTGPDIVFYRGFLVLPVLALIARAGGARLTLEVNARAPVIGLGLATALVALCYISSVAFVPVGIATVIFYIYPLLILVVSPLVNGERLTLARLAIFGLAFAGLVIAIGPHFTKLDPRGMALAAAAAIGATGQFFFAARATRLAEPATAGFWSQVILVPVALAICLAIGGPSPLSTLAPAALPVALTCGFFALAFGLHLFSARLTSPAALGLIFCAEPVTSIIVATLVLDETLTRDQLIGGLLVLIAIFASVALAGRAPQAVKEA